MAATSMGLTRDQRILVHQVHPAKLAVDIATSVVSDVLLWQHRLGVGLAIRYLSPVAGSMLVMRLADLERLSTTHAGRYVQRHMPLPMVAVRLAGDSVMALGAWKHRPDWLAFGALLVALGWSHGLLPSDHS